MAEVVQKHDFQDIYRIQYGTLLVVNKFRSRGYVGSLKKSQVQAKRGVSKLGILKEDVRDYHGTVRYPKGTIVIGYTAIEPVTDPKEYKVELKMSGGTFDGTIEDYRRFQRDIENILSTYQP